MKPTPIFVAAAGFAMIGACTVKTEDNSADSAETNSAVTAGSDALADNAGTDTLGNQLNQLNDGDAAANEAENSESNAAD